MDHAVKSIVDAAACAGLLALDRERHGDHVKRAAAQDRTISLLLRAPDTPIDGEATAALAVMMRQFLVSLPCAAARLFDCGVQVDLPAGACTH